MLEEDSENLDPKDAIKLDIIYNIPIKFGKLTRLDTTLVINYDDYWNILEGDNTIYILL